MLNYLRRAAAAARSAAAKVIQGIVNGDFLTLSEAVRLKTLRSMHDDVLTSAPDCIFKFEGVPRT